MPTDDEEDDSMMEVEESVEKEMSQESSLPWSATAQRLCSLMHEYGGTHSQDISVEDRVLRELCSNSLHALDTRFFGKMGGTFSWSRVEIGIKHMEDGLWLAVRDSGCGMTRGDLANRLLAAGVSRADKGDENEWRAKLEEKDALGLAFAERPLGVGLFAAFAIADHIRVSTKNQDDDAYVLNAGLNSSYFEIKKVPVDVAPDPFFLGGLLSSHNETTFFPRGQGTVVALRIKPGAWTSRIAETKSLEPTLAALNDTSHYGLSFVGDQATRLSPTEVSEEAALPAAAQQEEEDDFDQGDKEDEEMDEAQSDLDRNQGNKAQLHMPSSRRRSYRERSKYIPLRLSYQERKYLRLIESAVKVSGYVDRIDSAEAAKRPARRRQLQLQSIAAILAGIVSAIDPERGAALLREPDFSRESKLLGRCLEITRRYKILNPEKMRSEYGQLVYFLQDVSNPEIADALGLDRIILPVRTVYSLLDDTNGLPLLDDAFIPDATCEVLPDKTKTRAQIQQKILRKNKAVNSLKHRYALGKLSPDDVELCLCSICDNESYLNSARLPIDLTLSALRTHFTPGNTHPDALHLSLAISDEDGSGSRLSHSHSRQYRFAEQSLALWRDIVDDMFRLWHLAEADLLSGDAPYSLRDTGQGLQRVQSCPRTYAATVSILNDARAAARANTHTSQVAWVGSSMVHMGDHNVPNALTFLDKYAQVARILRPLMTVLQRTINMCDEDDAIHALIDAKFGSVEKYKIAVLADFFRHAFDGSGADNFYDAGSCVDGRLTSAWNWCNTVQQKSYYIIFKLTGFSGFDGEFA